MKTQWLILFLILSFSLIKTAYSQMNDPDNSEKAVQKIEIVVDSYSFKPDYINLKVGEPVKIELRSVTSLITHNFTIDDPLSGLNISANVPPGKDVSVTFTPKKVGKFQFYCDMKSIFGSHRKKGMEGTIEVVE